MNKTIKFLIDSAHSGERLDIYLTKKMANFTRSSIKKLIEKKNVKVNEQIIKTPSKKIKHNDHILVKIEFEKISTLSAKEIKLEIIYEDKDILIINKPQGMVVHPGAGNFKNTLVNALLFKYKDNLSNNTQIIGLHYRTKDYEYKLDKNYYILAIEKIKEKVKHNELTVCVFTDSIADSKKELGFLQKIYNCSFYSQDFVDDFKGMLTCDHLIIARSTFSWWAAYLLTQINKNSFVCFPDNLKFTNTKNLILDSWIKV